jgi:hypothetical protein
MHLSRVYECDILLSILGKDCEHSVERNETEVLTTREDC